MRLQIGDQLQSINAERGWAGVEMAVLGEADQRRVFGEALRQTGASNPVIGRGITWRGAKAKSP